MAGIANPLSSFTDFISGFSNPFAGMFGGSSSSSSSGLSNQDITQLGGLAALLTSPAGLGLGGDFFGGGSQPVGYQGKIPDYTATRSRVPNTYDPNRRPGSSGQRYFTDIQYTPKVEGEAPATPMSAEGLAALNLANPARQTIPAPPVDPSIIKPLANGGIVELLNNPEELQNLINTLSYLTAGTGVGGLIGTGVGLRNINKKFNEKNKKATGGMLDGATDGMADKVPAMIDGEDPAALSDGEYVITADVVGHLGNGNSDAGAKVLDDFMGDVRMARTNTRKQAPEINPQKFLPKV